MQQNLRFYNQEQQAKKLKTIRIGIGFHTGPLIMGIIGDDQRMDAATISDAVNIAARIESLTKHYGVSILLSEDSYQQISEKAAFNFRYLGQVIVKGKQEPIGIHECFDGDATDQLNKKKETLKTFERGLNNYFNQSFEAAIIAFKQILTINPEDAPSQHFLDKASFYLEYGLPIDWTGDRKDGTEII